MMGDGCMTKEYKLNNDFIIECNTGDVMSIIVIQDSLEWKPVLEEYRGITDKEQGNLLFKKLVEKYKTPLGYWH